MQTPQDPTKGLRSKDPEARLAAIEALAKGDRADADKLLISVLDDKDWEVQLRAVRAVGERKVTAAIKPLLELALDGAIARVRESAATSAAAIDAEEAAATLLKKARGKTLDVAQAALAIVCRGRPGLVDAERFARLVGDESLPVRESAAAIWLEVSTDRAGTLRKLLADRHLILGCNALDRVAAAPRVEDLEPLVEVLNGPQRNDVVERRALTALRAVIAAAPGGAPFANAQLARLQGSGRALARRARLAALLQKGTAALVSAHDAVTAIGPALVDDAVDARAAAAKALGEIEGDVGLKEAVPAAVARMQYETEARVRRQLLDTVVALRGVGTAESAMFAIERLTRDPAASVRERAAVLLGRRDVPGGPAELAGALADKAWPVAVCAAVSLGKTGSDEAEQPLLKLLKAADWKLRGAAAVGLMHWNRAPAVEPLIALLADPVPTVQRSSLAALQTMFFTDAIGLDGKAWSAHWAKQKDKHQFRDRRASIERQRAYGYAVPDIEIYRGLDVVVFTSEGDHIEHLLERLGIAHRQTQANYVPQAGVHPEAVFVCNCTGQIEAGDNEPLDWFVRAGGAFFGSCWALSQAIEKVAPGVLRKFETPAGEVLDDVRARPAQSGSGFLDGVFQDGVVPIYHLEGAHLIEVLDPELAEVLTDSPDAAERHGSGNLAAWFQQGHGVVLDSVNHFDLQGLEVAQGLKTERDRQAYAVDHMGLSFARWRETIKDAFWKTSPRAARSVPDLSAFRFITNFVRMKRIGDERAAPAAR